MYNVYMKKITNLKDCFPSICKEWNYTRNSIDPNQVAPKSNKKVWWICKKGHEWETVIADRTAKGNKCPYCSNQKIGYGNSLGDRNPELSKEWHPTKNGKLTPIEVAPNSGKKVWWICIKGHEWQAIICDRNRKPIGDGCPFCSPYPKSICMDNCLQTQNPELSKEWHPTKNGKLTPIEVAPSANKKVWWECIEGHEWQATINSRSQGNGCPFCKGIELKDGTTCSSKVEAFIYLQFKKKGKFLHNLKYPSLGECRYDFFFPEENKYIEVTSYNKSRCKWWFSYLRKIVKKKRHVENVLHAKFEFLVKRLTRHEMRIVRSEMK